VTGLQRQAILSTGTGYTSRQSIEMVPTIISGQMKKVGLADWQTSNGHPSASDPETRSDAKGIIVGSHDRQREPRLIKALS
jgi:hypothetical protein